MSRNSQNKQDRRRRKEQKKKEQLRSRLRKLATGGVASSGGDARQQQRILQQAPQAWPGEDPADVAVFDDTVLATLPPELAAQVSAVREALQLATDMRGEEALERTSVIPRSSSLSEWRLFIRGLVDWLANNIDSASEAWKRLDAERRPRRIAAVMQNALRDDLDRVSLSQQASAAEEAASPASPSQLDDRLLYHAKLLRRIRIDRAAIRTAESVLRLPEESKKLTLGPKRIRWLQQFIAEHRATEPELTAALAQAALSRAFAQEFSDLFQDAARTFEGPRHDRRNRLLTFFYFSRFRPDAVTTSATKRALNDYLKIDLPGNAAISESLRGAIASQIHLNEANRLLEPEERSFMGMMLGPPVDDDAVRKHFEAAMKAYPAHRAAYKAHADWIQSYLDNDRLTKPERAPIEDDLAEVMQKWSSGLPDDPEPRLWLVDYLLEREQLEQVKPHVDWLVAARHDDPRVRATPWKWQMMEAMRLCRRKSWLADVPARLAEAEKLWPTWLSKQWLPYFYAAWKLRAGESAEFAQQHEQIRAAAGLQPDSPLDACMMLGAAQLMRVPAEDLKPLRAQVDQAVKNLKKLTVEDLLGIARFGWDLHRARMFYPAYRMHGGKLAKELSARLERSSKLVLEEFSSEGMQAAVLWCSEHRCWNDGYELRLPAWYSNRAVLEQPHFAAAKLNSFLKLRRHWSAKDYKGTASIVRQAAPLQSDAYYRHWFAALADEYEAAAARGASPFGGRFAEVFGAMFDRMNQQAEDEDDLDFDPNCNCPECQAARRAYEAAR